jgi:DNA-binding GntR family transcriptional regulator
MARTGYEDIAAHYRHRIQEGEFAPGDPMPSMRDVADQFGVTITTANRAYRVLRTEGLTYAKPGVGTVVSSRRQHVTGAARLDRLVRTGRPYAEGETSAKHTAGILPCTDDRITNLLDVDPHDEIVVRTRVFIRDEKPAVFAMSCIHPRALHAVPEVALQEPLPQFWQELYTARTGNSITRSPERRGARLAYDYELKALEVEVPPAAAVPVLVLENVFHDPDGPLEVWEDVYAPGLWHSE